MSEAVTDRSGVERAAILLLALGEQEAAQVLKHLGAKDVQRVGAAMAQLSHRDLHAAPGKVHRQRQADRARADDQHIGVEPLQAFPLLIPDLWNPGFDVLRH